MNKEVKMSRKILAMVCILWLTGLFHNSIFTQELIWESIGPEGGNVSYLVIAPSDSNIGYAARREGSIYRSEDAGQNWNIKNWLDGYINSIDVQPFDIFHTRVLGSE